MIRASITALLLSAAPALAEGVPYAPCDYPGQYAHCPAPTPQPNDPLSVALQQAMAQGQAQGQIATGGKGGRGGNAQATGGRGGNAVSKNSNRNANSNRNSASTGPISIVNETHASAASANAAALSGCSPEGGSMSAGMQLVGWGVSVAACKGFVGHWITPAIDRYFAGDPSLMLYLYKFDSKAAFAFKAAGFIVKG